MKSEYFAFKIGTYLLFTKEASIARRSRQIFQEAYELYVDWKFVEEQQRKTKLIL